MATLTIRLDAKLEAALDQIARSSGRTKSEIAREALRRQVAVPRFRELRKALRKKIKLPQARVSEILDFVTDESASLVEHAAPADANIDADDALVLGESLDGRAAMFVTGDAALLEFGMFAGIAIVSPRQFWDALRSA
jgi:predicted nucleic acid-binding protein